MKKIIALTLALVMVFALAACGNSNNSNTPANDPAPAPESPAAAPEAPAEAPEAPAEAPAEPAAWAPDGPVTLIVSYAAGNGTDLTARILAKHAEKYIGQTIVIENVDGGSGSIGWSQLASADPDGMTIGFVNLPNFNSSIVNELGTYKIDDFAGICNHVTETSLVVVRADDDRFQTIDDLVAYGKEHDGELNASTNGSQASNHIGAQAFALSAGFTYMDIPQGNTKDELLSLRGGEADFCVVKVADIAGNDGDLRVLAAFSTERVPEYPDVPTLGEKGYYDQWLGSSRVICAPAGVAPEVIAFYEEAFRQAMEDPDYLTDAASFATDYKNAAETDALIQQQQAFTEGLSEGFWYE